MLSNKAQEICPGGYNVLNINVTPKTGSDVARAFGTVEWV